MPSVARDNFSIRLEFVDDIIEAHRLVLRRHRGALVNAGVVFLAAATEAFVKELFQEAAKGIFHMTDKEFKAFFEKTSKRLHSAKIENTEFLYFNLGMAWALQDLSWRGFSNAKLRSVWDDFFTARHRVAPVPIGDLNRWRNMLERFVPLFEGKVANHIADRTKHRPAW